jgi:hypothetical protein
MLQRGWSKLWRGNKCVPLRVEGNKLLSFKRETNSTRNRRDPTRNLDRSLLMPLGKFIRCLYGAKPGQITIELIRKSDN